MLLCSRLGQVFCSRLNRDASHMILIVSIFLYSFVQYAQYDLEFHLAYEKSYSVGYKSTSLSLHPTAAPAASPIYVLEVFDISLQYG
jgi:hypothetical protein